MRLLPFIVLLVACVPFHNREAQEAHVQRLCVDPNYAYETGYNRGLERRPLDTTFVEQRCAPERSEAIRDSFHAGYHQGMANAPVVVEGRHTVQGNHTVRGHHTVHGNHTVRATNASSWSGGGCRFSSDCGDGQTCRDSVCMGNGWAGDACWFSSDCNSGSCDLSAKVCR